MAEAVATRTGFVFLQQWFWPHIDMYVADHRAWRGCGRRVEALRRLYIYIWAARAIMCGERFPPRRKWAEARLGMAAASGSRRRIVHGLNPWPICLRGDGF